jgi:hypothetical protein
MVARKAHACKRPKSKKVRRKKSAGYERADGSRAFAVWIPASLDWTADDSAICLARQAGPGPRM